MLKKSCRTKTFVETIFDIYFVVIFWSKYNTVEKLQKLLNQKRMIHNLALFE